MMASMKTIREELLEQIAEFCERHAMSETRFGETALNARGFVHRLHRNQHSPTLDTVEKVRKFMRDYDAAQKPRPKRRATHARAAA